ncbi:serine kinase [Roseovarius sp. A21]|uniref:Serine kinase n=1 Tax=Roseovarius bejariae TaxID=2576383 RepID=A0A844CYK9_9RHOB|nr:HPr kinase/phosphatase C-terminal domain-containing protein [Roseovarius bejariae]MRU14723.1 serine kinase [Roseovarius bejariae]
MNQDSNGHILHATSVAVDGRAALIRGPSGSGKSGLALQLIAYGASLVSDDRTCISRQNEQIILSAPKALHGLIEARSVGILSSPVLPSAPLALIVDLTQTEDHRLPPFREDTLLGLSVPVIRKTDADHFPAAIMLYLRHGRVN